MLTLEDAQRAGQLAGQITALTIAMDDLQARIMARVSFKSLQGTLSDGSAISTDDLHLGTEESATLLGMVRMLLGEKLAAAQAELAAIGAAPPVVVTEAPAIVDEAATL